MRAFVLKIGLELSKLAGGRKKIFCGLLVAALAFACGAGLAHSTRTETRTASDVKVATRQAAPQTPPPSCVPAAPVVDEEEWWRTPALHEWENRNNGVVLPLNYDEEPLGWGLVENKVVITRSGHTLAAAGGTLYMLDADRRRVLWKYSTPQVMFDFAYVEATDLVYATAGDNTMFIFDAETGRKLHQNSRNGRAGYGAVIPYGADACLVMDSFGGYREAYTGGEPMWDGVTAWRGTKMLWHVDVPPDAELQVVGERIYAVTSTKTRILVREIKVPKDAR